MDNLKEGQELFNYLLPSEKPKTDLILQRIGESGKCLLTNVEEDLTEFPVDGNLQNFLASNMACVSRTIQKEFEFNYTYQLSIWGLLVTFNSPTDIAKHNYEIFDQLKESDEYDSSEDFTAGSPDGLVTAWRNFTEKHCKGLHKIEDPQYRMSMSWEQYLYFCLKAQKSAEASALIKPKSNIITLNQ